MRSAAVQKRETVVCTADSPSIPTHWVAGNKYHGLPTLLFVFSHHSSLFTCIDSLSFFLICVERRER
jgi:hypothetical protein